MKLILIRILTSLLFGFAIFYQALSAHRDYVTEDLLSYQQKMTVERAQELKKRVEDYCLDKSKCPRSLQDLNVKDIPELTNDGWGHPFVYKVTENDYTLLSYGQDGKPGGEGLDEDIKSDSLNPQRGHVPFWDYITGEGMQNMTRAAVVSGILSGVLCFVLLRLSDHPKVDKAAVFISLTGLFFAIAMIASGITGLHLPNPH
ncbi:hypothetical protein LBMAG21_05790 [Armatimonadota bacterium]|nr:hypothetical protein LBMAG21_05790 [Armatimonadota bacterium]